MELFDYLMAKKGHNTHRDLFSYLLGKNAGGSGTYTTFSGTSLNISNTLQAKIKNIALEGNTSQDGTPTPDTPIPIKVVTDEQNVEILNNNYFNINEITENSYITNKGVTGSSSVSNISNYIEVRGEEQITIEYDYDILLSTSDRSIVFYDENKNYISGQYFKITKKSILITPSQSGFIRFGYDKNCENIRVFNEKQTYPLSLGNIELAKIGNYKDYIFKNEVGSPYYNADLDLNDWYLHKEIIGENLWEKDWVYESKSSTPVPRTVLRLRNMSTIHVYFSNCFLSSEMNNQQIVNRLKTDSPNWFLASANNLTGIETTDNNNIKLNKITTFLQSISANIYYRLITPTNTKITDTTLIQQLENINNNARSYSDTTIIECTSASTDNETIGFSGEIKVTSVGLGNSLNTSLLSSNLQEETNIDDIQEEPNLDEIEEQNDEQIENEEIEEPIEEEYQEL